MNQGFNQKDEFQLTNKMIEDLPTITFKIEKNGDYDIEDVLGKPKEEITYDEYMNFIEWSKGLESDGLKINISEEVGWIDFGYHSDFEIMEDYLDEYIRYNLSEVR